MTFVDRTYPDVVADVLTTLTKGLSGERHPVDYDPTARPVVVPDIVLEQRPVRRVSLVTGFVEVAGELVPHTFSLNDYELVPTNVSDPADVSTLRFLPLGARRPASGTDVRVSYYPRDAEASLVTDVSVGSVARTLMETISKELAVLYTQLNLAYDSAFVETATGPSLDRVVALLDHRRFRAGRPVGTVRFSRRPASPGTITIPAGTPVTDAEDKVRYETVETHTMLPNESAATVRVRGATEATPVVDSGRLSVVQRAIAGVDTVTNERPTTAASEEETDEELRARARGALTAANKGTVGALVAGLLQLPDVRSVSVEEFRDDVPGEVYLAVSLATPQPELPGTVHKTIDDLRPAGIKVHATPATAVQLQARAALVLAGSQLAPTVIEQVHQQVRDVLVAQARRVGVGQKVRTGPLVAALLADERIVDVALRLGATDAEPGPAGADFQPPATAAVTLDAADVTFEPDTFDQILAGDQPVAVEVRAVVTAQPLPGAELGAVRAQLVQRLEQYVAGLQPGGQIDVPSLLVALRDESRYAIDPLGLQVTLSFGEQFAQVVQGGPAFAVLPGHTFRVVSVDVPA